MNQFTKMAHAYNVTHLMVDKNIKLLENGERICEITVTLDIIARLAHCSHEDVSFNIICLKVLKSIEQFHLSMWFKKN